MVIFRYFEEHQIDNFKAIVVNYFICFIIGLIVLPDKSFLYTAHKWEGFPLSVSLGVFFVILFRIIAKTVQKTSISIAVIAQKLSFIFPVIYALLFLNDTFNFLKGLGILLAIAAVVVVSINKEKSKKQKLSFLLPVVVFLGSGLCDLIVKIIQEHYLTTELSSSFTVLLFGAAFSSGMLMLILKRAVPSKKDIWAGIILGIPNYGSIYFLVLALEKMKIGASAIFPINNVAIVLLSSMLGLLIFNENFSLYKKAGLFLSLLAILIIGFWS